MADETASLDYFGRFRSPELQLEFIVSCRKQRSNFSYMVLTVMVLGWAITETIASTWFHDSDGDHKITPDEQAYGILSLIFSGFALFLGFILCSYSSIFPGAKDNLIYSYLQAFFLIALNLVFIVKMIKQIIRGKDEECTPNIMEIVGDAMPANVIATNLPLLQNILVSANLPPTCPSSNSFFSVVSFDKLLVMCFCPQLILAIIYEPRLFLVLGCHFTAGSLLLSSIDSSIYSILPILIAFLIMTVLLTELHFQRVKSFLNQRKVQQLLEENERNADETHAMELRSMIGNVAHDLKTPLASFTSGLDLIKEILACAQKKLDEESSEKCAFSEMLIDCLSSVQSCLTNIHNTNAFMLMTINRCIDYTKASKGMKLVPKYETVNLREALQFPIECMSNIQERIGIKLEPLSEEICSHIITDKQWLQENLLCLLSNAVKYSTEGNITITVMLQEENFPQSDYILDSSNNTFNENIKYLLFEVEDNGIGLSEEARKSLFNPFKQAQRLAGGTGLGLYSLAKRIESLRGLYGMKKRRDGKKGSLFWFKIPYKPDCILSEAEKKVAGVDSTQRIKVNQFKPENLPVMSRSSKKGLHILIVDDSPSILKMTCLTLKRQGHQIWTAENGEIALKRIEEKWRESGKGFDLVLMDLQMPVMDGLEATRRLRMMEAERREWMVSSGPSHQLIFGVSANSDHETMMDALSAGVDDFFGKPFSLDTLQLSLNRFVYK